MEKIQAEFRDFLDPWIKLNPLADQAFLAYADAVDAQIKVYKQLIEGEGTERLPRGVFDFRR